MQPTVSLHQALTLLAPHPGSARELSHQVVRQLIATSEDVRLALRHQFARDGLTVEGFQALAALQHESAAATVASLARKIGTTRSLLNSTLIRLAWSGLISRERARHDRRVLWVQLTSSGRTLIEKVSLSCNRSVAKLVSQFDAAELAGIVNSCAKLSQSAATLI